MYKYKAFISYNHNERDKKIAQKLQLLLEHYRIPKKLRNHNNSKSHFGKIFRDETDLPCGDLPEYIKNSLKDSCYLIIICSPEYRNSNYCREELKIFCKSHSKSKVLVVVSEGLPEEVIPDFLFNEETGDHNIKNKEPLAANIVSNNIQGNLNKLRKTGFAQIAAGLLGCSLDDIKARLKKRRNRTCAICCLFIFCVVLLSFYFVDEYILVHHNWKARIFTGNNSENIQWTNDNTLNFHDDDIALQVDYKNIDCTPRSIFKICLPQGVELCTKAQPFASIVDSNGNERIINDERISDNGININQYVSNRSFSCRFVIEANKKIINNICIQTMLQLENEVIEDNIVLQINKTANAIGGWGDNVGGRPSYTWSDINAGALKSTPVFNSISDSVIGDEKNFVGAREDDGDKGKDNLWYGNEIQAENDKQYIVRLYVHNNPLVNNQNTVAKNTNVGFVIPNYVGNCIPVSGLIKSDNSYPSEYWDGVKFINDKKFHLEYISNSALLENNGVGANGGCLLSDKILSGYIPIGYKTLDGFVPAGYQYASYIGIKVKAVFDE